MNVGVLAFLGVPEIIVILAIMVGMALIAASAALLLVWLLRRKEAAPASEQPRTLEAQQGQRLTACPRCGAPLSAQSPQGLCARCVLEVGMATQTEAEGEVGPHGTKVTKPPPPPEEIAKRFPQLEILECLGRGGMGVVYKARQPKLNRLVALKILAPEKGGDPRFAERFSREAQALARLNHPNIVTVYDSGETDGMFFLLMEYMDGTSLRHLIQQKRLKPEEALVIVPKICEALQYAHDQGVVHRDIKPENVLLNKEGHVKIADFGIAKMVSEPPGGAGLTQDQVIGTPHYMAPEQVERPKLVDHRADIYSLGVVFYEMLTGELPLGKFALPSHKVRVDVRLDEVVLHALEKEPERRYQHASEVKTDVETIATGLNPEMRNWKSEGSAAVPDRRGSSPQPALAGLLLTASIILWALLGSWTFVQPVIIERIAGRGLPLSPFQLWLFQAGSIVRQFGFVLLPMLVLLTVGSFVWLILSATRPAQVSPSGSYSDPIRVWAVRKAWGFGIASLCLAFGTLIWGGRALRSLIFGANTFVWQQLYGRWEWDATIAMLNLLGAIGFGVASYRNWQTARGLTGQSPLPLPGTSEPRTVVAARWTARALGTLLLLFFGTFIVAEGLPAIGAQPGGVQLNFVALGLMLGGFIVGWRKDGTAALLIASGWTLWHISEGRFEWNLFQTPLLVAALFAFCWWFSRGQRTGVLAATVGGLVVVFVLGRLLVPTNVFVRGAVTDAATGAPITNACLAFVQEDSAASDALERPNARTDKKGWFRLYVGWYNSRKEVAITAPGYNTLTTNLGPRDLGQRSVQRDFQLSAAATNAVSATDTNPSPGITMEHVPLRDAIQNCANQMQLNVLFDPQLEFDRSGPNGRSVLQSEVNVRWEHVTIQTALKTLLDTYELTLRTDPESGIARVSKQSSEPMTAGVLEPPPVVIRTVPESGATNVDPTLSELRVTFSKPMKDGSWAWCKLGDGTFPQMTGQPRYLEDGLTCVLPVNLQPGRTYATWINVDQVQDFRDLSGQPSVPYLLIFKTKE